VRARDIFGTIEFATGAEARRVVDVRGDGARIEVRSEGPDYWRRIELKR
jgi:hypothetical protein